MLMLKTNRGISDLIFSRYNCVTAHKLIMLDKGQKKRNKPVKKQKQNLKIAIHTAKSSTDDMLILFEKRKP